MAVAPEEIHFYVDPRRPWCYQTSRWARRLEALGEVAIDWRPFSLEVVNKGDDGRRAPDSGSAPALRLLVAVREVAGHQAAGNFYAAIAGAVHEQGRAADDPEALREALAAAGVDANLAAGVLADPASWDAVLAEHDAVSEEHRAFGVPTIVLAGGDVMFGPIIVEVPDDAEAVELWRHFTWLTRNRNFAELKRHRSGAPDLESIRRRRAQRAKDSAAA
ncbi:MAG: DsbA family protein [Candidatus Dormibacteraeota bacterium]|nr:DsbA family protein [Candidatus Dormibacteraeota bacterium]